MILNNFSNLKNWKTYLALDVNIFGEKTVKVVLEHAVDRVMVVVDHGKLRS